MSTTFVNPNPVPDDYQTPQFPGLYWPFGPLGKNGQFLYNIDDIWRFTLFWTIIFFEAFHIAAGGYAFVVQWKNWKIMWMVPVMYIIVGGVEALLAGSVTGLMVGAVYSAGYFRMSTWIPFIWASVNMFVVILSSFAIQGGL